MFPIVEETDLVWLVSERNFERLDAVFNVKKVELSFGKTDVDFCFSGTPAQN